MDYSIKDKITYITGRAKGFGKFFTLALLLLFSACTHTEISDLMVEYETTPLGIDVENPRLSWQMSSNERSQSQSGYQIVVTDEEDNEVWNTGRVATDISLNIKYSGKPLKPATRYEWRVIVWNQDNKEFSSESWFETGLMDSSITAWESAKWIGGGDDDLVLYPDYLPTFDISYTIQLDKEKRATKAGSLYGANDPRLMNKNMNIFNLQNVKDESYIEVELDISNVDRGGNAIINVFRVGYAPLDSKETPLQTLDVPLSVLDNNNMYDQHTIFLKTMYSVTEFYVGGEDESNKIGAVTINPNGNSWDYICFPLLCEIGFSVKPDQSAKFSDLEVRNYRVPNNILFSGKSDTNGNGLILAGNENLATANGTYAIEGGNGGTIITANMQKKSIPMLRTTFSSVDRKITKARLYITSRGIYEVYLNGERVGDDYFNPGLTQYNKHHLYQTYDVKNHILTGDNALGVVLGEGWWSGAITYLGHLWNLFGDRQALLAKLVITYADGMEETIVSDPDSWSYFDNGPIVYSSFFQGEVYDARKASLVEGWSEAAYDDSSWKKAVEVNQEKTIVEDKVIESNRMPAVNNFSDMKLIGQFGQTVKKVQELTSVSMEEVRPGIYVYDMGQNMVGVPHISLRGEQPGTKITLRFAEEKYPDLPEYKDNVGMIMLENIRGALAQDIYITKGGNEVINPGFTFHGYRYIEITGINKPLPLDAVKGDVLSSIQQFTSSYETSNPLVNKLWENITWSTKGNFLSIPTDCPQRNERMGWSGDISVFSRTATYLGHLPQFLRRHMLAMRDTQREDGRFADVAPIGGGFGGILWGSAGITVAWESYQQYNDIAMLEEHYDAMKSYIDYLVEYIDPVTSILTEGNLGDWLGPEQDKNDNSLLWETYFIFDLELMNRMAKVLKNDEDALWFAKLRDERKMFFNKTYLNAETGQTIHSGFGQPEKKGQPIGTQTSYVLPLAFDICNEEIKDLVVKQLMSCIENESRQDNGEIYPPYSLMTGFIGTAWINRLLSDLGYSQTAYQILQQKTYPSWLYSVEQGATTIWERLNSYTREHGFSGNNSMNSFNHYSFGAIGSWMYNHSLGIERDEDNPGFKHFILQPEHDPTGQMTWAKGHYDSMYGRIESSWEIKEGVRNYRFWVPSNTTATLHLQATGANMISEGNRPLESSKDIQIVNEKDGKVIMKLQSGEYQFIVNEE